MGVLIYSIPFLLIFSILFASLTHPLAVGLVLLFQTILVSVVVGLFSMTYWFSYILFLIFLGGMLVLFIYVASLASNEQFMLNKSFILFFFFAAFLSFCLMLIDPMFLSSSMNFLSSTLSGYYINLSNNKMMMSVIYDTPTASFTFFIISYLLLTLFVVVNIMISSTAPLRSKN
uniref:NADH dehydrogenase subunit 6 n=1 Tax=Dardanus hessii TaxID=2590950 RepID=UPI002E777981|nr:NADH dehydrogenase subunit 6 [Dardanus hessii]WPN85847.1 NADH dehydrogenase subunit 6 [Dardanus hessii]